MRGKKGPTPEAITESVDEANNDPTIESIVGEENVVRVEIAEDHTDLQLGGFRCATCTFTTDLLSKLEEHAADTGHGRAPVEDPVQPELFGEPGIVYRMVNVMLPTELLNEKRERLATLYQRVLDVKSQKASADSNFNEQIKGIDTQMQEIARVLKTPFTYGKVDCEWRIIDGENARGLHRLDTGEQIEKQPLTAEDRAQEIAAAEAANQAPEPVAEEVAG